MELEKSVNCDKIATMTYKTAYIKNGIYT